MLQIPLSEAPEHLEARSCCVVVANSHGKTAVWETRSGGACTRASVHASCRAPSTPTPGPPPVNPRATKEDKYTSNTDARSMQTPSRSKNEKRSSRVLAERRQLATSHGNYANCSHCTWIRWASEGHHGLAGLLNACASAVVRPLAASQQHVYGRLCVFHKELATTTQQLRTLDRPNASPTAI